MRRSLLLVLASALLAACAGNVASPADGTLSRIAFGSCANQLVAQPIWDAIAAQDPDVFLLIGDAIYADYDGDLLVPVTAQTLRRDWQRFAVEPHFAQFRRVTDVLATWDNHDYGAFDGGAEFDLKEASKTAFLDFFNEPADSERRRRPGIYTAQVFGEPGRRVQVILLDTRYFKNASKQDTRTAAERSVAGLSGSLGLFLATDDESTTLLGADQWRWLEEQLLVPAEIRLMVSSTQVIPDQKGMDEWGNFPHERRRLFNLIAATRAEGVILLSGNVHFAELSLLHDGPYPLVEFTSSGLTHTNSVYAAAANEYRVGKAFDGLNFGLVDIDWEAVPSPEIQLRVLDGQGQTAIKHSIALSDLQHRP